MASPGDNSCTVAMLSSDRLSPKCGTGLGRGGRAMITISFLTLAVCEIWFIILDKPEKAGRYTHRKWNLGCKATWR